MIGLNLVNYHCANGILLSTAFAYNAGVYLDVSTGSGAIVLNVYQTEADAAANVNLIEQRRVTFGQVFVAADPTATPPVAEVRASTAEEFWAPPAMQAAYATLAQAFLAEHRKAPALAGATAVN